MSMFELHFSCFPEYDSTFRNVSSPKHISGRYLKIVQTCKKSTGVGKFAGCKYCRWCLYFVVPGYGTFPKSTFWLLCLFTWILSFWWLLWILYKKSLWFLLWMWLVCNFRHTVHTCKHLFSACTLYMPGHLLAALTARHTHTPTGIFPLATPLASLTQCL